MPNSISRLTKWTIIALFSALFLFVPAHADHNSGDWDRADGDHAVLLHLDGMILTLQNDGTGGFLRQGYGSKDDGKRNVEADRGLIDAPRGKGYDWVLEPAGKGYWYIINLKTHLYLTFGGSPSRSNNVTNWGWHAPKDDDFKWKFLPANAGRSAGYSAGFHIVNKRTGSYLRTFGGNVTSMPLKSERRTDFIWRARGSIETGTEKSFRHYETLDNKDAPSSSVSSLFKLTIKSVKAIKTSTGQDAGTKVLFAGIDLAADIGMAIGSGGASAAGKAAAKAAAKAGTNLISRSMVKAAAKAALRKKRDEILIKGAVKGYQKFANRALGDPQKALEQKALEKLGLPSGAAAAANVANDVLDAMSSEAIFNKVYGESPDDLEIFVNGTSIWPNGGRDKGRKISSQQTKNVNRTIIFDIEQGFKLQLVEYDWGSSNDSLGWIEWQPHFGDIELARIIQNNEVFEYDGTLVARKSEGSLYEVNFKVEPLRPYMLTSGILNRPKREEIFAKIGCEFSSTEECARYVKQLMKFKNWAKRPKLRDIILKTYEETCINNDHKFKTRKLECRSTRDPLPMACDAGHTASCDKLNSINNLGNAFINSRIWEGNCHREGSVHEEDCIKLATTYLQGAPYKEYNWQTTAHQLANFCSTGSEPSCRMTKAVSELMCDRDVGIGCYYLGWLAQYGHAEAVDVGAAKKWYIQACDLKEGAGCASLGEEAYNIAVSAVELDRMPNFEKAHAILDRACGYKNDIGCELAAKAKTAIATEKQQDYYLCKIDSDPKACTQTGKRKEPLAKTDSDTQEVMDYYQLGCELYQSDGDGCVHAGKLILKTGVTPLVPQPMDSALTWFKKGCDIKSSNSCLEAGKLLLSDDYPSKDVDKAYDILQAGCEIRFEAEVCDVRNQAYDLKPDVIKKKECDAGNAQACLDLGNDKITYVQDGKHSSPIVNLALKQVPEVYREAVWNYNAACELNLAEGCKRLGDVYILMANVGVNYFYLEHSDTTFRDGARQGGERYGWVTGAQQSYEKACKMQHAHACEKLANILKIPVYGLQNPNGSTANHQNTRTQQKPQPQKPSQPNNPKPNAGAKQVALHSSIDCNLRGSLKSVSSGTAATVEFYNKGKDQLFVYWLDEQGTDTDYQRTGNPMATIASGQTTSINAELGLAFSVFSVVNGQTFCVGVVKIDATNMHVTMSGDTDAGAQNAGASQTTGQTGQQQNNQTNSNQVQTNQTQTNNVSGSQAQQSNQRGAQIQFHLHDNCRLEESQPSQTGGADAKVTFTNEGSGVLYMFWRDEEGDDTNYDRGDDPMHILQAGDTHVINSRIGFVHSVYLVENDEAVCAWVAQIANAETHVSINGDIQSNGDNLAPQQNDTSGMSQNNDGNGHQASNQIASGSNLDTCDQLGAVASNSNGTPINLSLNNAGAEDLYLFWINENGEQGDFEGGGDPVLLMLAGQVSKLEAEAGDIYAITDANFNCIGLTPPLMEDRQFTIN